MEIQKIPGVRKTKIRLGESPVTIHLYTPAHPTRWVVMPSYNDALDAAIQQAGQSLYNAQMGVMSVQLDSPRGPAAAEQLQAAMRWLRKQPEAQGLPVSYFGVDVGTAAALQAASGANDVSSVVSWNGRPELAWNYLGEVRTPVLLMVDEQQNWLRQWANQAVDVRLGPVSQLKKVAGLADMADLALDWMSQNRRGIFSTPRLSLTRRLVTGAAALALCSLLATTVKANAAPSTTAAMTNTAAPAQEMDPFTEGLVLKAANIAGDESVKAPNTKPDSKAKLSPQEYKLGKKVVAGDGMHTNNTGSAQLVDGGHVKWFANTNITFSSSSSVSGAMSEASFTVAGNASTVDGGTVALTVKEPLNDAFDGYNGLMINGNLPAVATNMYNQNGPVTFDCNNREVVYAPQTSGNLTVQRKVYVPENYAFARWTNIYTNTGSVPLTINTGTSNNLGSDSNTIIVNTSNGDTYADLTDQWVTTMQNFTSTAHGALSSDPRLGHVMQGYAPPVGLSVIHFANGDDHPYWGYHLVIPPGATVVILNFATVQPSKAAANTMAAWLADVPTPTLACMTSEELASVVNFNLQTDLSVSLTAQTDPAPAGRPLTYTMQVTNAGPYSARNVKAVVTLPVGASFVSGSGTGWTVTENSGVVTATLPTLDVGAAPPVTIQVTAPVMPGTIQAKGEVSADNKDPNLANNVDTPSTVVQAWIYMPFMMK